MGIQINGQTDIISATDGSLTIQGASGNLTGDLTGNVTGNVNATGLSTFSTGLNVGTGASISSPATNVLALGTNDTERVRIDSSGNVTVANGGSITATQYGTLGNFSAQFGQIRVGGDQYGNVIRVVSDTNMNIVANNNIYFNTGAATDGSNYGSNVAYFGTNGLYLPSGLGIDFSATANSSGTMTSELLSDYEEGTFNPTIFGWTGTYSIQYGQYTKIGRQVFIHCEVLTNANTGSFTELFPGVGNLPFAISSNSIRHLGNWGFLGNQTVPANSVGAGQWDRYNSTALFPNDFKTNAAIGNWNSQSNSVSLGYRSFISYFVE